MPEDVKKGPSLAEIFSGIVHMYVGDKKSIIAIFFTVVIVFVLIGIGGMMALNSSLQSEVSTLKAQLDNKDGQVMKPAAIAEIKALSDRVKLVTLIVKGQPFMTTFLKLLEYSVEDDIVFEKTTLAFINTPGKGDTYAISIDAKANRYSAVLNQFQTLQEQAPYNKFFTEVRMNNFAVDKEGKISFKITGNALVAGPNLTPEEVEKELLKVLSVGELPTSGDSGTPVPPTTPQ